MKTIFEIFTILIATGSVLFGNMATSQAFDRFLGGPIEGAAPLVPQGTEFQGTNLVSPDVAIAENGNFVVVGYRDDNIYGQRYDHTGSPVGPEFCVNTALTEARGDSPNIAMSPNGSFVVVWTTETHSLNEGTTFDVFGRVYDKFGNPLGWNEFQVNHDVTHLIASEQDIAMDDSGNFVVVWKSDGSVYGQRYNAIGSQLGSAFQVNAQGSNPAIAMTGNGAFAIVYSKPWFDVFGQRFNELGHPEGPEFQVNTTADGHQQSPDVAMDMNGNFMVVWESWNMFDNELLDIYGQRYNAVGSPLGTEFKVNTYDNNADQRLAAIAVDGSGNMVVVWESLSDNRPIYGQRYDTTGNPIDTEVQINTTDPAYNPAIAIAGRNMVVVWSGFKGQRYTTNQAPTCDLATPLPSALYSNDHAFQIIEITQVSDHDGDSVMITVNGIHQDESVLALRSGQTSPDGQGIGTNAAEVRDEHVVTGNGRQYRINFTAEDGHGGSCMGMVFVRAGFNSKYDWDWIIYDSTKIPFKGVRPQPLIAR